MVRLLFWNLKEKDLTNHICEVAKSLSVDVIILIEAVEASTLTLKKLQSKVSSDFYYPRCRPSRFQLFCRDARLNLSETSGANRVSFRQFSYADTEFILGVVHVVDKKNWDSMNQSTQVALLAQDVRRIENKQGHNRTILIGDFNMNPFDQAMNMASGMNAMMTTQCVERGSRILQEIKYDYFYNPMWSLFGDRTPGPPGTFYHSISTSGHFGWNMLDQVLFRPSAIPLFGDVQILTTAGSNVLHTKLGRPDKNAASDHFPLLLTLK